MPLSRSIQATSWITSAAPRIFEVAFSVAYALPDPAYFLFPGLAVFFVVLSFNLLGDGLRDALDPKSGRS